MLKPDFEIAVIHLGNLYLQQGRYREAIQQYRRYISLGSSDFERARSYNSIAYVQRLREKFEEAERYAKLATKYEKWSISQPLLLALQRGDLSTAARFRVVLKEYYLKGHSNSRGSKLSLREAFYYLANFDLKSGARPRCAL